MFLASKDPGKHPSEVRPLSDEKNNELDTVHRELRDDVCCNSDSNLSLRFVSSRSLRRI